MKCMTEEQLNRYESFRRSSLARPKMKKLVQLLTGTTINDKVNIALCAIGKLFVGELIETARIVAAQEGHAGALLPRHVQLAYQILDKNGKVTRRTAPKRMFHR